ncbi:sulfatase family protein [Vibrio sp. WXL103]|uniref:sulfatase family protein n=1 Tax=Vibrio sp. WXL103 TaxID=3450710 RepID=UPI003EC62AF7
MKKPNILLMMPDQLRPDFLGAYGADFLKTPALDTLAEKGTVYTNTISPSPMCVPARGSLMTGLSPEGNGVIDNLSWIRPDHREMNIFTWPEILQQNGYATAAIGKMHFYPWDESEGFETRIISEDKRHISVEDDYYEYLQSVDGKKLHGNDLKGYDEFKGAAVNELAEEHHIDRWVGRETCKYLESRDKDKPFAVMVGFPGPHCPYDPPADELSRIDPSKIPAANPPTSESQDHYEQIVNAYTRDWANTDIRDLTDAEIRKIRHHYAVLVERIDEDVKKILATLEQTGELDNTVVIFCSDHGDYLGDFKMLGKAPFHEPSIRIPMIVRDYRAQDATTQFNDNLKNISDLFPTILTYAGCDIPKVDLSGQDLAEDDEDRIIIGVTTYGVMARSKHHKLAIYNNESMSLFDISKDPGESSNLIHDSEHAAIRNKLEIALVQGLVKGLKTSNYDKKVNEFSSTGSSSFHERGWQRTYPTSY